MEAGTAAAEEEEKILLQYNAIIGHNPLRVAAVGGKPPLSIKIVSDQLLFTLCVMLGTRTEGRRTLRYFLA